MGDPGFSDERPKDDTAIPGFDVTAMKFPAVLLDVKEREDEVAVPASFPAC
jgi:hypothetical protein